MENKANSDYLYAYKAVLERLKKAYEVECVSDISSAMTDSESLMCDDQIFRALYAIDPGNHRQIHGAAAAFASIIICEDDIDIEQGSTLENLVSTLAISLKFSTFDAACELVRQMFGEDKAEEFESRLDENMSDLLIADKARNPDLYSE